MIMEGETTLFDSYLAFDSYLSGEKHPYNFIMANGHEEYSSFAMPGEEAEFLREAYDNEGVTLDRDFYPLIHRLGRYADNIRFELSEPIEQGVQQMPEGEVVYQSSGEEVRWDARMDKGIVAAVLGGGEFETVQQNVTALEEIADDFDEIRRYPPETRRMMEFDRDLFRSQDLEVDPSNYSEMSFEEVNDEMEDSIRSTEFREGLHPSSPLIVDVDGYEREFVPGVLGSENADKFFRRKTGYGTGIIDEAGLEGNQVQDMSTWVSKVLEAEGVDTTLYADISEISEGDVMNPADPHRNNEVKGFATTAYLYFEDDNEFVEVPNGIFIDRFTEDQEFMGSVLESPELPELDEESEEEENLKYVM